MTACEAIHLPLSEAFLCASCSCIGNDSRQCPACASEALMSLANVLDRTTESEEA